MPVVTQSNDDMRKITHTNNNSRILGKTIFLNSEFESRKPVHTPKYCTTFLVPSLEKSKTV